MCPDNNLSISDEFLYEIETKIQPSFRLEWCEIFYSLIFESHKICDLNFINRKS